MMIYKTYKYLLYFLVKKMRILKFPHMPSIHMILLASKVKALSTYSY
jgi:hypothetical protein